jgi:uncharacterized protein YkwD
MLNPHGTHRLNQATPIQTNQSLTNRVHQRNRIDLFSFNLSDRARFTLKGKSSGSGTRIELIQDRNQNGRLDAGERLKRFTSRAGKQGSLDMPELAAGTYFIRVTGIGRTSQYHLNLASSPVETATLTQSNITISEFGRRVVELTNQYRLQNGLSPLALNNKLTAVAQAYSERMARQDFVAHQAPDGSMPWERMTAGGYQWSRAAENLAAGQQTPEAVVQSWINSPSHRENLLDAQVKEIGVGYYFLANDTGNVNYNYYWTQNFGSPA